MKKHFRKGKASIIIPLVIAFITSMVVFGYMQFNTTTAYISQGVIKPGTKITEEMLNDGTIEVKQIPKSMTNKYLITDFNLIKGKYAKYHINPGHPIYLYDIAKDNDLRTNENLVKYGLEAVSIPVNRNSGISNSVKVGDRVNIYGIYSYNINSLATTNGGYNSVLVKDLPTALQEIFKANGYSENTRISGEEITVSKLLIQNVPIVDVEKYDGELKSVTVGLEAKHLELIHLTMKTGRIGFSLLPYNDNGYIEKNTKGAISTLELSIKGTLHDGEKIEE